MLNIEIGTGKIDVNVHPAKLEIRFTEEQKVFKAVYHGIKETLLKADLVMNIGNEIVGADLVSAQFRRRAGTRPAPTGV